MEEKNKQATDLIEHFGGVTKVARMVGVTTGAVSQWKNRGVPKGQFNLLKILKEKGYSNERG